MQVFCHVFLNEWMIQELDLKDKIINHNQEDIKVLKEELTKKEKEISDPKEKIKEKDGKKKNFSFVSVQTKYVPKECLSS